MDEEKNSEHNHREMANVFHCTVKTANTGQQNLIYCTLFDFLLQEIEFRIELKHAYLLMKFYANVSNEFDKKLDPIFYNNEEESGED